MPAYRYILIIIQLGPFQITLQPVKLTHYSRLIFNELNSLFKFMFSYFFSILPLLLSKGTGSYFLSSAKFPSAVNSLAEISRFMDFLLACQQFALEPGWFFACLCSSRGEGRTGLWPAQTTGTVMAWPHKDLRCDGWWRQRGRGTRKEPDTPEPVLLPSKSNIESYCKILENLAFGCWKNRFNSIFGAYIVCRTRYNWLRFKTELSIFLPYPSFSFSKIGDFFFYLQRQRVVQVSSTTCKRLFQPNARRVCTTDFPTETIQKEKAEIPKLT